MVNNPVTNSTNGYRQGIGEWQRRHFAFNKINDNRGILSYQEIFFLHRGQNERPVIDKDLGSL